MVYGKRLCALGPNCQTLLRELQRINFGRIEDLVVKDGQPVLDPAPRVIREVKFGGENGPRPECDSDDFQLKDQVVDFLNHLDHLRDGIISSLEVKNGLPFRMLVTEVPT